MAMRLGRNFGKSAAAGAPFSAGFGASFARGPGGAAFTSRLPACHFFSDSQSSVKRKLQDTLAEFKDLSPKEYFKLTVGTTLLACSVINTVFWALPSDISRIKNFTMSKLGNMRDGGDSSKDGGGSSKNGV